MSPYIRPLVWVMATAILAGSFAAGPAAAKSGTPKPAKMLRAKEKSGAEPAEVKSDWEGHPPYGNDLMTRPERKAYWREFLALPSDEERDAYYVVHIEKMKQRAVERGVSMPEMQRNRSKEPKQRPRFWRPPYFEDMMTEGEIEAYFATLDEIPDSMDRTRYVARHIRTMYDLAQERGVSAPLIEEFDDVFEILGEAPPDLADRPKRGAAGLEMVLPGDGEDETDQTSPGDEEDDAKPEVEPMVP